MPTRPSKSDSTSLNAAPASFEAALEVVAAGAGAAVVAAGATTGAAVVVGTAAGAAAVEECCPAAQAEDQSMPIAFQSRESQLTS